MPILLSSSRLLSVTDFSTVRSTFLSLINPFSIIIQTYLSFFFFSFIIISWRLITSQHFSGFRHTLTWISHGVTCIPHPDPPSHLPLHPIPLKHIYLKKKKVFPGPIDLSSDHSTSLLFSSMDSLVILHFLCNHLFYSKVTQKVFEAI